MKKTVAATMSEGLHHHLALSLRDKALTRKLQAVDKDECPEEFHPEALEILSAVELSPERLAKVTALGGLSLEDIALITANFDGESDPFVPASLDELLLLPNLEVLDWPTAMPRPPVDVKPLLALKHLRRVVLEEFDYVLRGSRTAAMRNDKAAALLEAAGFTRTLANGRITLTRAKTARRTSR